MLSVLSTEDDMQVVKVVFGETAEICLRYVLKCVCSHAFLCLVQSLAIQSYWHTVMFEVCQYADSL